METSNFIKRKRGKNTPDISKQKFGKWTVIEYYGTDNHRLASWICRCECGEEAILRSRCLRHKKTTQCRKCSGKELRSQYEGKQVRNWKVLELFEISTKGHCIWKCQCKCGNISIISSSILNSSTAENCLECSNFRFGTRNSCENYGIKSRAYQSHLLSAKIRNYISYLTFEEYCSIASKPCVYCKKFSKRKNVNGDFIYFNSVDRTDNEPFYKIENSQSTCFICQFMKKDMKDAEFKEQIKLIYNTIFT